MKIFLSRWVCLDVASNMRRMAVEARQAAQAGATLCLFPESFLHGYTQSIDVVKVRETFHQISEEFPATTFIFGSISEERKNRMTVWRTGREIARYDKVHLFPPNREQEIWNPGDRYAAIRFDNWTVGLINCNDIRFPEQARALRLQAKCQLLVAIAWWPWQRDHIWAALLRARAIENGVFVAGCALAASEVEGEKFAGAGNYVFDPIGDPVFTTDECFYDLDPARADQVIINPDTAYVPIEKVEVFE